MSQMQADTEIKDNNMKTNINNQDKTMPKETGSASEGAKRNTFQEDEMLEQEFNAEQLRRLGGYMKPYAKEIFVALIIILLSTLANLVTPLLIKFVIDDFIPDKRMDLVLLTGLVFGLVIVVSSICMKYRIRYMSKIGQSVIRDIRGDLFKHLQSLPFTYYDSRPHGKILVRVVNYINSLSDLLSNGLINLVVDFFSFFVALAIMLMLNVKMTLIIIAFVPIAAILIMIIKNKQRRSMQLVSAKQSNMNAYIHESISGMKVVQSFTREDVNLGVFLELMDEYKYNWMKSRHYISLIFPVVKNISIISMCVMLLYGLFWTNDVITAGVFVALLGYTGNFWMPLLNISEFYNQLVAASAYLERIFETMDVEADIRNSEQAYEMPEVQGNISYEHVDFGYEPGQTVLKDFNLDVEKGETIALVGPTGAGKSTVVNLLSRFYDVNEGAVKIDGHDIREVTLHSLRSQMGVMMQDTFIFSGTIIDNIRYGKLDASDEEVMEAAKYVRAHDFIKDMEKGYYTEVNERGTSLSTGQRQLISFARALLRDPKILILDEATSSIDTQTELLIQEGLNQLLKGRTSFVIAHRLSTIKNASRILVINNQGIEEMGSHDELMKTGGHYYDLYSAQVKFLQQAVS